MWIYKITLLYDTSKLTNSIIWNIELAYERVKLENNSFLQFFTLIGLFTNLFLAAIDCNLTDMELVSSKMGFIKV